MDSIVQLSVMDGENMEFDDSSFDKVVAMYVASVVPDPERLVDEMLDRFMNKADGNGYSSGEYF
jgi:ubiquinone/menaquinone biosynthesis C-methylase UbiE